MAKYRIVQQSNKFYPEINIGTFPFSIWMNMSDNPIDTLVNASRGKFVHIDGKSNIQDAMNVIEEYKDKYSIKRFIHNFIKSLNAKGLFTTVVNKSDPDKTVVWKD